MDELLADFLTETNEGLAEADRALAHLERAPEDAPTLAIIFRAVHTIKGSSGFLELPRLGRIAHAAEDILVGVRDGAVPATPAVIAGVLAALDQIKALADSIAIAHHEPAGDDTALIAALGALARSDGRVHEGAAERHTEDLSAIPAAAQTIRVGVDLLESLMTLVSELVLTRNQLVQLARGREDGHFETTLQRLSHLTSDLQEGVMKTRMQPIGHLHSTLSRLVRGLSLELGKRIELVMVGEATELDRQVMELMRDPLIHMIRNSADHGLEDAAGRVAAGKPAAGRITLNAYHEGGHVVIELGDDGAGLQTKRIWSRAVARGLATEAKLAAMTEAQIHRFILQPGFTTTSHVSSVSGRGVGMDVVRSNVERIGGTIALHSVAGQGTDFTIRIPLTLAIISAFIVEAGGQRFALPQACVVELVRLAEPDETAIGQAGPVAEWVDGTRMLRLRENLLALVHLRDVLKLEVPDGSRDDKGAIVVVLSVGTTTLGLVVDQVFDTEEIVVKPVAPLLRHITMFGGKTILGDGSVIMILEPNGLARALGLGALDIRPRPAAPAAADTQRSSDRAAMLLFRATRGAPPSAVPLSLVARIETMQLDQIETSGGRSVTQYRGTLMPLVAAGPLQHDSESSVPVLVFIDRSRAMGLMVHEVVDVIEDTLAIELSTSRPELLGTAVIGGRVTDVIDAGYWLTQAWQDWFQHEHHRARRRKRLLVVEDSNFFRHLLVPLLASAGYDVTAVDSAARALALRDTAQAMFDAVISDVEMPGMDGMEFARIVRQGGAWTNTPLLALSGRYTEADAARGREAGFSEFVCKLDRETLLKALHRCMAFHEQQAA